MASRHELHDILVDIVRSVGMESAENRVYFQPNENVQMIYPCIVYKGDGGDSQHADNIPYVKKRRYMITVIDQDPDSKISEKVSDLSLCTYERDYTSDNLNHFVYNIYF